MCHKTIGQKMCRLRNNLGLTATELGKRIGISKAQISRLESGKQGFRSATLSRFADALGVEPVYFFIEEDDKNELGKVGRAAALYGAVAHPSLAKALESPLFLELIEKLALVYFDDRFVFRRCVQQIEFSHDPRKKGERTRRG